MNTPTPDELRARAIAEAYTWLGTPYVECADVKGPKGGVDCALLLIRVGKTIGRVPQDYDPRPYSPDWHLHQDAQLYMEGMSKFTHRVGVGLPGDFALFKFGRHASHGAILVSDELMIHAHKRAGMVELCERRALEEKLYGYWSII